MTEDPIDKEFVMRDKNKMNSKTKYDKGYFNGKTSCYPLYGYTFDNEKRKFQNYLNKFIRYGCVSGKILDVGCAFGFFLKLCDELNIETFGMDVSQYALEQAKKYTKATLVCQSATDPWPFDNKFFDGVALFDIIEHTNDSKSIIKEAYRTLNKNGVLYITTPNKSKLRTVLNSLDKRYYGDVDATHINVQNYKCWVSILKKECFEILDIKTRWLPVPFLPKPFDITFLPPFKKLGCESEIICKKIG